MAVGRTHTDTGSCVCDACLREWGRRRWQALAPAEREAERLRRLLRRDLDYLTDLAQCEWEAGNDTGELEPEDLAAIRGFLIARVVQAGGGRRALALLHGLLAQAERESAAVGPSGVLWDDPDDCVEWYESEGGYPAGSGVILSDDARDYLYELWADVWAGVARTLFEDLANGGTAHPMLPPARVFVAALLEAATPSYPLDACPAPPERLHHRPTLGPLVSTGPPAPTWAHHPQVPTAAA